MSLSIKSPKEVVFRSAIYFEKKGLVEKAIILYRKAGATKKSVELATMANLTNYIVPDDPKDEENDPDDVPSINNKVNSLIDAGKYDRAVTFLISSKQHERALDLSLQYNVPITDDLIKKLFPDNMPAEEMNKKS
jgi:intraflagellar transport protein 140